MDYLKGYFTSRRFGFICTYGLRQNKISQLKICSSTTYYYAICKTVNSVKGPPHHTHTQSNHHCCFLNDQHNMYNYSCIQVKDMGIASMCRLWVMPCAQYINSRDRMAVVAYGRGSQSFQVFYKLAK